MIIMRYCTCCLIPDTRPNGEFDESGRCRACLFAADQVDVNFEQRLYDLERRLEALVRHRRRHRWNCIVGVSGGKDSHRQALWVRDRLGLKPLLVSIGYPPRQQAHVGPQNLANLIALGFDCISISPGPKTSRDLVREGFLRFGNWQKATEMALFSGVQQVAISRGIDLVLWGENPALQVGDTGSMGEDIWDGNNLRNLNTLAGGNVEWFDEVLSDSRKSALYRFPSHVELARDGVNTIFLGPAWSDWSFSVNTAVALLEGFRLRGRSPEETGDLYASCQIDEDWTILNAMIKWLKFGFGQGTEQANALIRSGLISREEGVEIATRLDGACDDANISTFCDYIGISTEAFWAIAREWTNRDLFDVDQAGRPTPRFVPGTDFVGAG